MTLKILLRATSELFKLFFWSIFQQAAQGQGQMTERDTDTVDVQYLAEGGGGAEIQMLPLHWSSLLRYKFPVCLRWEKSGDSKAVGL